MSASETNSSHSVVNSDNSLIVQDYQAIKTNCGLRLLDDRLIIRVTGDDRVSFLHGMCTADIKALQTGTVAPALFVTEHAHVVADCFVYACDGQELWLEVERSRWPMARAHLEKLLVADDVEMEELDSMAVLDLEGPAAAVAAGAAFGAEPGSVPPWHFINKANILIANLSRYLIPATTLIGPREAIVAAAAAILKAAPQVREISADALEIVRIERGLARVGIDTTDRTLALEALLERAISFNKGCYVGQETIERATARGALKRRLCALRLEGKRLPPAGAPIMLEGKEVGRLSSVAFSPDCGAIGLATLHHSAWPDGTRLTIGGGADAIAATVGEPPCAPEGGQ
jgi:folate-binding protein YgfZ